MCCRCSVAVCLVVMSVLFFKHKTAYEMRISDWSSDVCSSDLKHAGPTRDDPVGQIREVHLVAQPDHPCTAADRPDNVGGPIVADVDMAFGSNAEMAAGERKSVV